jgi:dipeptidase D
MKAQKLAGLQPENVFAYFEKICSIPHGGFNTAPMSDYLESFAKENSLRYLRDGMDNVIIFKPATAGYESHEPVILQSHTDMVCQAEGREVDWKNDPVAVTYNEEFVYADRTTLGADDGIGMALTLALLADKEAAHPPIEAVFTVNEEVGLLGAAGIDLSVLKGRRMLNLDTPYDNVFNVGCGGGSDLGINLQVDREEVSGQRIALTVENLHGGHSGSQIGKAYANANHCMAQLLEKILQKGSVRLQELSGGAAGNIIPSLSKAVIACDDFALVQSVCEEFAATIREAYDEPNATVTATLLEQTEGAVLTAESTRKVLNLINDLPNGVQQWSEEFKELPLLSLNLGVMKLSDSMVLHCNMRSGVNSLRKELENKLIEKAEKHGCSWELSGGYSAWEYRKDSPLRDLLVKLYVERFDSQPVVRVVHSGLECGVLSEQLPGLDCVSMGPTIYEIHTVRERLSIASTGRTYEFLKEILKNL